MWVRSFGVCAFGFALAACGSRSAPGENPDDSPSDAGDGKTDVKPSGCFTKIAAGGSSACALRADGALFCWGNNTAHQLAMVTSKPVVGPTRVETLQDVREISLGGEFGCALTGEGLQCFGQNNFGQVGAGDNIGSRLPTRVDGLPRELLAFSTGGTHACAADTDGKLYCWGNNGWNELGIEPGPLAPALLTVNRPAPVALAGVQLVAAGDVHTCAAAASVALYCWGGHASPASRVFVSAIVPAARKLAAGSDYACAITTEGALTCWGTNGYVTSGNAKPAPVAGLEGPIEDVACGWGHACAIARDGSVLCWGMNRRGALGRDPKVGDNPDRVARRVAGIAGHAIGVAVGLDFSCTVTAEGEVWCWGSQDFAQLGVVSADPEDSPTPRRVALECP